MACATLKRTLEWEPIGGRPTKRRRCIPFSASPSSYQEREDVAETVDVFPTSSKTESVFPDVISHKLTPEYMAASIKAEIRRLQRRRQLQYSSNAMEHSSDSSSGEQSESHSHGKEQPLFTFKEVGLICERMIRERESEIRQEYDNVLTAKLSEQYEAFVKFTYDQIQRSYHQSAPSYLS